MVGKKLEEYKQTKPEQLSLFELLQPEDKKYSSTIELYDFIPKYVWGKLERIQGRFLDTLEREFECRGKHYKVKIRPARMDDGDGIERDYYPGKREEVLEDALRKLVCEGQGLLLDDEVGVLFTLSKLQDELKQKGHAYSKDEIKDALFVCTKTNLEVYTDNDETVVISSIFTALGITKRQEWENNPRDAKCFVRFNPLVTASIKNRTFRQLDYETMMRYKSVIARQLHKRLSHHYTQASLTEQYQILLSTIIRDFGLVRYTDLRNNLRDVKAALEEMKVKTIEVEENGKKIKKEVGIVLSYTIEKRFDPKSKRKLEDALVTIVTYANFNADMRLANVRHQTKHKSSSKLLTSNNSETWSSVKDLVHKKKNY